MVVQNSERGLPCFRHESVMGEKTCHSSHQSQESVFPKRFYKNVFSKAVFQKRFFRNGSSKMVFQKQFSKNGFPKTVFQERFSKNGFSKTVFQKRFSRNGFPETIFQKQGKNKQLKQTGCTCGVFGHGSLATLDSIEPRGQHSDAHRLPGMVSHKPHGCGE